MTPSPSELIIEVRKLRDESLRKFAKSLGVSYQTILNWEQGVFPPDPQTVGMLVASETPWIRSLGLDLYAAQCRRTIQSVYPEQKSAS
jgi:transcriptional regulator with XRE-family HTH domain